MEGLAEMVATGVEASWLMVIEVVEKQPVVVLMTVTERHPMRSLPLCYHSDSPPPDR